MGVKKKMTHIGVLRGCDARVPSEWRGNVLLRETKCYWITRHGTRYSKKWNGSGLGDWPMYRLDLDSIIPIEERDRSANE